MKKSERIVWSQMAIDTALNNPAIQKQLQKFGITKESLLAGKSYVEEVLRLEAVQRQELGERYDATDELNRVREQARTLYTKHVVDARHALRDQRGSWEALGLDGKRKIDLFEWLAQADTFYSNVGPVMSILKKYNVTESEVAEAKALIQKVMEAYHARNKEASEAKTATQQRNAALKALNEWMKRFVQTAKLAFADEPRQLEVLGILKKKTV
jgi:GTP1/Obg family GTP-binding protein